MLYNVSDLKLFSATYHYISCSNTTSWLHAQMKGIMGSPRLIILQLLFLSFECPGALGVGGEAPVFWDRWLCISQFFALIK